MGLLLTPSHPVEDIVYELPDSDFSNAAARVFDKLDNGKYGALPLSRFGDFIEMMRVGGVHSEDMEVHLRKVDPNKIVSLDRFVFVRWYVDKKFYMDYKEEVERLMSWYCKFSIMALQLAIFLKVHSLKKERGQ